jgi:8-hydroxy-5-deazaflavin:NADPH oxidoreductase
MRIGVLGTGAVGRTLATKLVEIGHDVRMGARSSDNEAAREWVDSTGERSSHGSFADAAAFGELLLNCTAGAASLAALESAGEESLSGKILLDVANPLDFSRGMPPSLAVTNTDSLGEQIQRRFPEARVIKALNTINHQVMVEPGRVTGEHDLFVCGNDEGAKGEVTDLLDSLGWPTEAVRDLGDISAARATEGYLPLWLRLMGALGTADFNIRVVR